MPDTTTAFRLPRPLAFLFALLTLLPCSLHAQDVAEPWITITPSEGTFSSATVSVTITFHDDASLNLASRQIVFNGANVTSQFTHSGQTTANYGVKATSSAVLTLAAGSNVLTASVNDAAGNPSWPSTAMYTFNAGRPQVRVTPDGGAPVTRPASSSAAVQFWVKNVGTGTGWFRLSARCRDGWTGDPLSPCAASADSVQVAAGDSAQVSVSFQTGAANTVRTVQLAAERRDAPGMGDLGWVDVEVYGAGGTQQAPMVSLVDLNSTAQVDRDQCVTVSAGVGAAYECGDLRLAHAVPAMQTRGKVRAPVLLYNSQHAHPRPTVYADVTVPGSASAPTQVIATVSVNNVVYTRTFNGSDWLPGTTRRIAVQWDGLAMPTGVYAYTLQVTSVYGSTQYSTVGYPGEIAVVNRANSPYGAGWWLAGLEQIQYLPDGARTLWIGGDGSTRLYTWVATNTSVAPAIDRPDTLRGTYVDAQVHAWRRLPGGAVVWFDPSGRHYRTINRLGDTTKFAYDGSSLRVGQVSAPRRDGGESKFFLSYTNGLLTYAFPAPHNVGYPGLALGHAGSRVTTITDPDGRSIGFSYEDAQNPNRVTARTDKRLTRVSYGYDAAGKLASVRLPLEYGDTIRSSFQAAEGKGVTAAVPLLQAHTLLDGPRTDVADHTSLWLTRWGAPRRIRDAMGGETLLTRGSAGLPALVTEVRGTDGGGALALKSTAVYDTRGRVASSTAVDPFGAGTSLTTTYTYDDRWDAPTTVTAPGAGVVSIEYDAVTGNPLWQQQGDASRRVYFDYNTSGPGAGMLARVRHPHPVTGAAGGGGADSIAYDALGNVNMTRTPEGFLTLVYRDALGRDTLTITPTDSVSGRTVAGLLASGVRQRTEYDVMGRVWKTQATGPAMSFVRNGLSRLTSTPQETLFTENQYNEEGALTKVRRWTSPNPASLSVLESQYTYDRAGRRTSTIENNSAGDDVDYDPAGNVVQVVSPRATVSTSRYDALGRMVERVTERVHNGAETVYLPPDGANPSGITLQFPTYIIPADTARFVYDLAGRMVRAENRDAIVIRGYFPGGALETDSLMIRSWSSGSFPHVYGIRYGYDAYGRTQWLEHPSNLAGTTSRDSYAYHSVTGALSGVTTRSGHTFSFQYDLLGRLVQENLAGGAWQSYQYDLDGRKIFHNNDRLYYDGRGKILHAAVSGSGGAASNFRNFYSGLGMLAGTDWTNVYNLAANIQDTRMDALGTVAWQRSAVQDQQNHPEHVYEYEPGTSRVSRIRYKVPDYRGDYIDLTYLANDTTARGYDESGNAVSGWKRGWQTDYRKEESRSYYGAGDRLAAVRSYVEIQPTPYMANRRGSLVEYRYDALGRRVLVRTTRDGVCVGGGTAVDCTSGIERFVYAGDNVLWEMRGPGKASSTPAELDQAVGTGQEYGAIGYTHAGGVDRPLAAYKLGSNGAVIAPYTNWRGQFSGGTYLLGSQSTAPVSWPGYSTTAWYQGKPPQEQNRVYMGTVLEGQRDASGQMYMRNRMYDPQTGQFTQTDPIGMAGGLNTYGFAAGDPVSYYDPYGLCPLWIRIAGKCEEYNAKRPAERRWIRAHPFQARRAARIEQETMSDMESARVIERYTGSTHNTPADALRHAVLSCRLTVELGARSAEALTNAHEQPRSDGTPEDPKEVAMDQHNNKVGRQNAANTGGDANQCLNHAYMSDAVGELQVINDPRNR